ncbi:hydrogenase-1 operon protein HyaE [Rhodobacter aestuarii]|uniref:Hydrogenase expression/formation protein n=1 Tax=Rhodobacter aestuarii TaxID=453582 RepID=A0A1N7KYZ1_9RHOB|nr:MULTISPECIES: hydrogenase accessory protein [Rhodobacter]PTV95491.1 hydrogenase-1 operon protein HyaE [Rhodobacter aestuarii]SIS66798.1 hydrogenase-1 operon protein HyaE [Rhodobacter aestuarii]SOB89855.1 hydrogenase-1 operon protein HyaE [Rhodobacter sp. JA431]
MHDFAMPDTAPKSGKIHPLVTRLTEEFAYPRLENGSDLAEFTRRPGVHCLFVPGDAARNLETPDAAVVLPELRQAFQNGFDCAVVGDGIETTLREETRVLKTPSFIFFREGEFLGGIEKIRDWDDYIARTSHILTAKG